MNQDNINRVIDILKKEISAGHHAEPTPAQRMIEIASELAAAEDPPPSPHVSNSCKKQKSSLEDLKKVEVEIEN